MSQCLVLIGKNNIMRRKFLKLFSASVFSFLLLPYKFLYSNIKKIINQNLTDEQKNILFNEGTERPFTSSLLHEKRDGFYHCANCDAKLFNSNSKLIQIALLATWAIFIQN